MTNEEAIRYFKRHIDLYCVDGISREAEEMAIQALSQEPCTDAVRVCEIYADVNDCENGAQELCGQCIHYKEPCDDAISRDMALEKMADYVASGYADSAEDFEEYSRIICQLPSITQKPIVCDDAISCEAVIEWLKAKDIIKLSSQEETARKELKALPPVTPQQKYEKWIDYREDGFVECPFCGHATNCEDDIDELHYCFYCGARMVEPQESSEDELKDLSKRVETLEKQMKEDKEEQLRKLKAELDYAKFRCTL